LFLPIFAVAAAFAFRWFHVRFDLQFHCKVRPTGSCNWTLTLIGLCYSQPVILLLASKILENHQVQNLCRAILYEDPLVKS